MRTSYSVAVLCSAIALTASAGQSPYAQLEVAQQPRAAIERAAGADGASVFLARFCDTSPAELDRYISVLLQTTLQQATRYKVSFSDEAYLASFKSGFQSTAELLALINPDKTNKQEKCANVLAEMRSTLAKAAPPQSSGK